MIEAGVIEAGVHGCVSIDESKFLRARAELRRQVRARSADGLMRADAGRLINCAAFLAEDNQTIVLFSHWHTDTPAVALFRLQRAVDQSEFESVDWVARLQER
jgi:hypothetical protein